MNDGQQVVAIESWLESVRTLFIETAPELLPLFDIYAAEAQFGRRYVNSDLGRLRPGARILEVGAGSLLLSCQLVREGFDVTALDPVGDGFMHFDRMRQLVLATAHSQECAPKVLNRPGEALDMVNCFDYAFSVNVMEHVNDVVSVIGKVGNSLVVGASYRFICPNYLFPYEPHFNIPTLFFKQITALVLGRKIFSSQIALDPRRTWRSLNWINVIQVKRGVRGLYGLKVTFNRSMLPNMLERIASDTEFAGRRHPVVRSAILMLVRLRLQRLFRFIPAAMQPIMDCRIEKAIDLETG